VSDDPNPGGPAELGLSLCRVKDQKSIWTVFRDSVEASQFVHEMEKSAPKPFPTRLHTWKYFPDMAL
jgi:hypothetical protein